MVPPPVCVFQFQAFTGVQISTGYIRAFVSFRSANGQKKQENRVSENVTQYIHRVFHSSFPFLSSSLSLFLPFNPFWLAYIFKAYALQPV